MIGSTIFIAGMYGTGKSTMCSALSKRLHIPTFSAGDLISEINGEQYGANKVVSDKNNNQAILVERIRKLNRENGQIILAGHFCIFNAENGVEILPESIYAELRIIRIVLLEADIQTVIANLHHRDEKVYSEQSVSALMKKELEQSERIAKKLNCPLNIYKTTFTDRDSKNVASWLTEGDKS